VPTAGTLVRSTGTYVEGDTPEVLVTMAAHLRYSKFKITKKYQIAMQ